MSIQVGINKNVYLADAGRNEKGTLKLTWKQKAEEGKGLFAQMTGNEEVNLNNTLTNFIFGINVPKDTDKITRTADEKKELVSNDMARLKNQLAHIMEQYMTKDKFNWTTIFTGTGITDEATYNEKIGEQQVLDVLYKNIVQVFLDAMKPFIGNPEYLMRLKLIRQSKEKQFATLPSGKYLSSNPFLEPMTVPESNSNVKFTDWEKKEGLDQADPISASTADKPAAGEPQVPVGNVFGQR